MAYGSRINDKVDQIMEAPRKTVSVIDLHASKVPVVTLGFWIIKVAATTLGETAGDAVLMSMHLGYAIGSAIFISIFVAAIAAQVSAKKFHPFLYWP
ncbi:putative membrane-anchored protein [Bradyrhizobium betae]|nr:putative membrane-anchored protein [Bradyrhizobium betae]